MDSAALRLDWLRAFLAVIDTGGFTAAAARLHLSQPALHTQVKQLAAWAGPLYRFEARRLHLTPRGQQVERLARELLARIDSFVAADGSASYEVRIFDNHDELPPAVDDMLTDSDLTVVVVARCTEAEAPARVLQEYVTLDLNSLTDYRAQAGLGRGHLGNQN